MGRRHDDWPVIGIDLGTTSSCVGIWQDGGVHIITNDQDNKTMPCQVAFTNTERLIGEAAENQGRSNPTNTIFDAKRLIGRAFSDEMVQEDMKLWPFKVIPGPDFGKDKMPIVEVTYKGEVKHLSAEEISAMVLTKMKGIAEAYLGMPVKNVVITVPAYFNDSQRHATNNAVTIAGFYGCRIISEPTAAVIAYDFDKKMSGNYALKYNVLVFDLGGGSFDVSLVSIENNTFKVKAVCGDAHLGGCDFDNRMVSHFVEEFKTKHKVDISQYPKALGRLRAACEKAKRALSIITQTSIELDGLYDGIDFRSTISRAIFESLNDDLFRKCIHLVQKCLYDAHIDKSDVDDIVLVGGSTRIPKVQQELQELFGGKELSRRINPDEAVAYGAAVYAGTLQGMTNDQGMIVDITPFSLGLEQLSTGNINFVFPRNTAFPTKLDIKFKIAVHHQESVFPIYVYEGESHIAQENKLLGVIELCGISPSKGPSSSINVCFEVDINRILKVSAIDTSDGNKSISITNRSRLTIIEMDRMVGEAEYYKAQDKKHENIVKAKNALEDYANPMRESLTGCGHNTDTIDRIEQVLEWIDFNSEQALDTAMYEEKLKELKLICEPSISYTDIVMTDAEGYPAQDRNHESMVKHEEMVKAEDGLEDYANPMRESLTSCGPVAMYEEEPVMYDAEEYQDQDSEYESTVEAERNLQNYPNEQLEMPYSENGQTIGTGFKTRIMDAGQKVLGVLFHR